MAIYWERAVLYRLCLGLPGGHLLGKSCPLGFVKDRPGGHLLGKSCLLGFVKDSLVAIYWERAVFLALFRIAWWPSTGKELFSSLCLG